MNTFVPARLGDAVRVGLLSRAFEERGRVLTTTGVLAFLGVARAAALMLLVLPAAAAGMLPIRWLAFPGGLAVCAVAVAVGARRRSARRLVVRFLDAFRLIGGSPSLAGPVVGWLVLSSAARLGAAAASAAALGTPRPLAAAAIIVPALELANLIPLTPGNLGITSAVVALALKAQGVETASALAVGVAFHAVETVVGVSFGVAGALKVFRLRLPAVPQLAAGAVGLALFVTVGAVLGVLLDVS